MKTYKSKDVTCLVGISKIQLQHWINTGCIYPEIDDPRRGGVRYFSQDNLSHVLVCKALNEHGVPVKSMKLVLDMIRSKAKGYWEQKKFIVLARTRESKESEYAYMPYPADKKGAIDFIEKVASAIVVNLGEIFKQAQGL